MSDPVTFSLAQIECEPGGWAAQVPPPEQARKAAETRWALRSYRPEVADKDGWVEHQCGGCRYFAAAGADYGICWNEASQMDGCVTFEHGGCAQHSYFGELRPEDIPEDDD